MSSKYVSYHPKQPLPPSQHSTIVPDTKSYLAREMYRSLYPTCVYPEKCCTYNPPCPTYMEYQPLFPGCAPDFVSWKSILGEKEYYKRAEQFEVGKKDPDIWVADLNPIHYRHQLLHSGKWYPEMSKHPHARQLWMQYLTSTLPPQSSPYSKPLDHISESLPAIQAKYGRPQFVHF